MGEQTERELILNMSLKYADEIIAGYGGITASDRIMSTMKRHSDLPRETAWAIGVVDALLVERDQLAARLYIAKAQKAALETDN